VIDQDMMSDKSQNLLLLRNVVISFALLNLLEIFVLAKQREGTEQLLYFALPATGRKMGIVHGFFWSISMDGEEVLVSAE
jgi:hypothetical protein